MRLVFVGGQEMRGDPGNAATAAECPGKEKRDHRTEEKRKGKKREREMTDLEKKTGREKKIKLGRKR